jgi:hypothetical protein
MRERKRKSSGEEFEGEVQRNPRKAGRERHQAEGSFATASSQTKPFVRIYQSVNAVKNIAL